MAFGYRSEVNSCRDAGTLINEHEDGGGEDGARGRVEGGRWSQAAFYGGAVCCNIFHRLKISCTEVLVCIFIDVSLKAREVKVGKLNVTQPGI